MNVSARITLEANCSTYNPCGRNGYCENDSDGQLTCVCRFWWEGTFCNELTSSGKQVIALGVITGCLAVLYYGLGLYRLLCKKETKLINENKTLTIQIGKQISSKNVIITLDKSQRLFYWITVSGTFFIGVFAVIIKGIIVKNIHKEIVYKFNHNESLFYNPPSICRIIYMRPEFNMFTFPVACLIILIFTFITKRESTERNRYCKGYVALPIPLDFFSSVKRTFAAITFAIFSDELANIANQFINQNGSSTDEGVIVTYILQIVKVLVIGFRCYPILAAVYINTTFALVTATLYAWFDFSMTVAFNGICRNDFYSTVDSYAQVSGERTIAYFYYYGTGSKLIFFQLLAETPRYLFHAYISVALPILLFKHIQYRKLNIKKLPLEQKHLLCATLPHSAESRYVQKLFGLRQTDTSMNRIVRFCQAIYKWRDDFRFSSRVLCVYSSVFFLLFFLTLQTLVQIPPSLVQLRVSLQQLINLITNFIIRGDSNVEKVKDLSSYFPVPDLIRPYFVATFTALAVILVQLLVLLGSIRRNLLQAFRADDSEIPRRISSKNVDYACNNIHFAGYLIAYVLWGYVLITFVVMIIGVIVSILITYGLVKVMESIVKAIIPALLFALFQIYMNRMLARYVFLQRGGDVLSINHRRILMIYLYFNFFLDAFLGVISSFVRLLKGAIVGMIYVCRLDCSSMGGKLETLEAGFGAYCGFIHMECAHRHPVLLYFTSLLLRQHLYGSQITRCSKAKLKWYLAIFLLNNPTLIYRRKGFLSKLSSDTRYIKLIEIKNMKKLSTEPSINDANETTISSIELGND